MNIGVDIDDTITAVPEFFKSINSAFIKQGHVIHIITSRTANDEVREITQAELKKLGVVYNFLYILPAASETENICPYKELDWYQKYILTMMYFI